MSDDGSTTAAPAPRTAHFAVGFFLALAVFVALQAGLLWAGRGTLRQDLLNRNLVPVDQVDQIVNRLVWQNAAVNGLFAVASAGFALVLRRGRPWARAALTLVGMLQLFLLFVAGGLSVTGLVVLALLAGGLVALWLPATTAWLADLRGQA
ncbi:hypothetical protein [Streptoalloteichus hindustanus]|uniref:Uncharacterized protein n=1 Tax=Streptoalloteichus hindustanus TaxID=2017 RepID=A0A1M4TVW3_STRHI|nr:hypothetical protein [Streptoalloteichus hindustanus]SHE48543.1 hypothetical protein SAMN05444320_101214 [Streptoalloteichus hindustanus]